MTKKYVVQSVDEQAEPDISFGVCALVSTLSFGIIGSSVIAPLSIQHLISDIGTPLLLLGVFSLALGIVSSVIASHVAMAKALRSYDPFWKPRIKLSAHMRRRLFVKAHKTVKRSEDQIQKTGCELFSTRQNKT